MANQAGRSARAVYERRSARDRANRPRFSLAIVRVLFLAGGTYVAVRLVVVVLNHSLEGLEKKTELKEAVTPPFSGGLANEFGLLFAVLVGVFAAIRIGAPRQSTVAWRQGAEGEERLGHRLDQLTGEGFVILHDRRVPGSQANIDHLVVGPTGVFVVDAKNFSHQLSLARGTLWTGKYPVKLSSARNQARRAETALASLPLGRTVEVLPLVCVVGSARLPRRTVDLDGVRVVSDWQTLVTEIRKRPTVLTAVEVATLSRRARTGCHLVNIHDGRSLA
jgi:hypothetical protein